MVRFHYSLKWNQRNHNSKKNKKKQPKHIYTLYAMQQKSKGWRAVTLEHITNNSIHHRKNHYFIFQERYAY
jgi:hypothetical protein